MAVRVISSDSEEDSCTLSGRNRPIRLTARNSRVIDSDDEDQKSSGNSDIDSFSSSDVYSESESGQDDSFTPQQAVVGKRQTKQRAILSSDEEEDSASSPLAIPVSQNENNSTSERTNGSSILRSSVNERTKSGEDENECGNGLNGTGNIPKEKEISTDVRENDKENVSPSSETSQPEKPLFVPLLSASKATPMIQPLVPTSKGPPPAVVIARKQTSNNTFSVAHTRPALLKQLEYVKGLQASLGQNLPDKGANLVRWERQIIDRIKSIKGGDMTLLQYNGENRNDAGDAHKGGWSKNKMLAQQFKHLTNDAVEQLHSAMQSRPATEMEVADPKGLKTSLMPHQRRALAWALWRETQAPSGGILADDMGLGKTLTMLSLILAGKERDMSSGGNTGKGCPTLVVCPASLMRQWDSEISNHLRTGQLRVLVYHSDSRTNDARMMSDKFDVVITTYGIVGSEGVAFLPEDSNSKKARPKRKSAHTTLFEVHWNRIILDEGHTIKNPKTNTSLGVCGLSSAHRWVLTGTPVHNSLKDIYSLVKFLRLAPFDDYTVWKELVQKSEIGMRRLQTLVQSLLLRRTKAEVGSDGQPLVKLPSKLTITHPVSLNEDEQSVFDLLFAQCRSRFLDYLRDLKEGTDGVVRAKMLEEPVLPSHLSILPSIMSRMFSSVSSGNAAIVLVTILRLLQCSCHLGLLGRAMEMDQKDTDNLEAQFASMSISSTGVSAGVHRSWPVQGVLPECFSNDMPSSKVGVLLDVLKDILESDDSDRPPKCVLVSQWSSFLDIIERHVRKAKFTFVRMDGSVPPKKRNSLVEEFNSHRAHPQLLLMTLKTGGVGLNLTRGSHLFLMDMHWNPALEQQAADRIHRLGQTSDVTIHRFLCRKTAEEKVVQIQESKKRLASDVLSCATGIGSRNKLTLDDLKLLFSI